MAVFAFLVGNVVELAPNHVVAMQMGVSCLSALPVTVSTRQT